MAASGLALAFLFLAAPARAQCCVEPQHEVPEGGGESTAFTASPPAERLLVSPTGVDLRTGRYDFSQTDLSIGEASEGGGLALTRSLGNDAIGHINPFGNFSHNLDIFLDMRLIEHLSQGGGSGTQIRVHFGGRSQTFEEIHGTTAFVQTSRSGFATLTASGSVFTFTSNDGTIAVFRSTSGECSTILGCAFVSTTPYADGTRLTFDYDAATTAGTAHLRSVTSNRGYALKLNYGSGADSNFVTSACLINLAIAPAPAPGTCPAGSPSASYAYATFGTERRLAAATDAGGAIWGYAYSALTNGFTMAFTRPGEAAPWLTNTVLVRPSMDTPPTEVIVHQSFADNSAYDFSYDLSPLVDGEIQQIAGGQYVDPAGHMVSAEYGFYPTPGPYAQTPDAVVWQITPGPTKVTDALGRVTNYDYCERSAMANLPSYIHNRCLVMPVPVSFTEPDGRETILEWDFAMRLLGRSTRHPLAGSVGLAPIVTSATYNCSPATMAICARPVTATDARGNTTEYVYSATHGGLLSVTGPEPTAGAPRPQTRHEYAQRYAWIANGTGGYVQAATPIWVRTATSACRTSAATGAPCAAGPLDEVRTVYDYGPDSGPNNLLLRGQAVTAEVEGSLVTHRTCYGYDARGRRISETQPNANSASCP